MKQPTKSGNKMTSKMAFSWPFMATKVKKGNELGCFLNDPSLCLYPPDIVMRFLTSKKPSSIHLKCGFGWMPKIRCNDVCIRSSLQKKTDHNNDKYVGLSWFV